MAGGGGRASMRWPDQVGGGHTMAGGGRRIEMWDAIQIPFDLLEEECDVIDNTQAPICTDSIEIAVETPLDVEHTVGNANAREQGQHVNDHGVKLSYGPL
nr:hypothetical protein Itr_chr05CG11830 [Ipomoea trifida]